MKVADTIIARASLSASKDLRSSPRASVYSSRHRVLRVASKAANSVTSNPSSLKTKTRLTRVSRPLSLPGKVIIRHPLEISSQESWPNVLLDFCGDGDDDGLMIPLHLCVYVAKERERVSVSCRRNLKGIPQRWKGGFAREILIKSSLVQPTALNSCRWTLFATFYPMYSRKRGNASFRQPKSEYTNSLPVLR